MKITIPATPAALLLVFLALTSAFADGGKEIRRLIFIGTADLQGRLDPVERTVDLGDSGTATPVPGRYFHFFDGKSIFGLVCGWR